MEQAKQAGATITDPAHDSFWGGYSGHFQDPMDTYGKSFGVSTGMQLNNQI